MTRLRSHRSDRYKISELMTFIAGRPLPVDSPSLPFCIRFNVSPQTRRQKWRHVPYRDVAILDAEPVASSYSDGNPTRLSSNHFQSARAWRCYPILSRFRNGPASMERTLFVLETSNPFRPCNIASEDVRKVPKRRSQIDKTDEKFRSK